MSSPKLTHPFHWLAFGLGSGLAPKAPGTFGTLAALPVWWLLLDGMPLLPYLGVLIAGLAFGVVICDRTSEHLGVHDHGGIVWDEWIGMWITLLLVPEGWLWVLYAFALFRLFDILNIFFYHKKCVFLGYNFLFVSGATQCPSVSTSFNPFLDPAV